MNDQRNLKFSGIRSFLLTNLLLLSFISGFSQNKNYYQSPFTLDLHAGMALPGGDLKNYADNGFQAGFMFNRAIYKNLSLGLTTNYHQLNVNDKFQSPDKSWTSITLGLGPQYTILLNKFFVQLHGHLGVSFINTPAIKQQQPGTPDYMKENDLIAFQLESGQNTGFSVGGGFKTGVNISDKIRLFAGTAYSTDLNKAITYNERDLSKAIHPTGEVNMDMVNSTPFEKKQFSFSDLEINLGLSINLGKTSAKRQAQDYNSSRSNKPRPIKEVVNDGKDSVPGKSEAQDYNSSRSNKPSPIREVDNNGKDSVPGKSEAQDYNSSRSNKPRPIGEVKNDGKDSVPGKSEAQDYNSSRSNKPSPIREVDNSGKDSVPGKSEAQDYNSSRSNKPSPIREVHNNGNDSVPGKSEAQDYNSSRSNKPRPIGEVDNNGKDSVPGKSEAQDYNSSRSNKPRPIGEVKNNEKNSIPKPAEAQDYNSSRSNKANSINIADKDKKGTSPKSKRRIKRRNSGLAEDALHSENC